MDDQVTQTGASAGTQRVGRRRVLGAGIGGAALSLLPFLGGRASASSGASADTTTTAPPKRPTADDTALLASAQQLELTIRELYDTAISGVKDWTPEQATVMVTIREAHEEYANSFSGLLGRQAPGGMSESLFNAQKGRFSGTPDKVLAAAATLESGAVATYAELLGQLQGINGAALAASIQIAEARHSTVLAQLSGSTDYGELLVDEEAEPLQVNG